jgi:hypothetical protein
VRTLGSNGLVAFAELRLEMLRHGQSCLLLGREASGYETTRAADSTPFSEQRPFVSILPAGEVERRCLGSQPGASTNRQREPSDLII